MRTEPIAGTGASPPAAQAVPEIVVNGRFLTQPVTGVQRYARELIGAIDQLLAEGAAGALRVRLALPPVDCEVAPYQAITLLRGGRLRGHAWEQLDLPRLAAGRLLFSPCNTGPAQVRRQVVTIHDAAVFERPEAYSFAFRTGYRLLLRRLARVAAGLIAPSAFSRASVARCCGIEPSRIEVVHHGAEHALRAPADVSVLARHGLGQRPFVLAVSSMSANKNFPVIAAAMQQAGLDLDVAVVGGRNARVFAGPGALPTTFRALGRVTDGELRALYERALCLVYPSWYEGFGLPPLEAMACGCPVVVSASASLPEICGEAAAWFEPHDAGALADRVREMANDPTARTRLREAGLRRVERFRWQTSAARHLQYLERLIHA